MVVANWSQVNSIDGYFMKRWSPKDSWSQASTMTDHETPSLWAKNSDENMVIYPKYFIEILLIWKCLYLKKKRVVLLIKPLPWRVIKKYIFFSHFLLLNYWFSHFKVEFYRDAAAERPNTTTIQVRAFCPLALVYSMVLKSRIESAWWIGPKNDWTGIGSDDVCKTISPPRLPPAATHKIGSPSHSH